MSRTTTPSRLARTAAVSTALAVALVGGGAASALASEPAPVDAAAPVDETTATQDPTAPAVSAPAPVPDPTAPSAQEPAAEASEPAAPTATEALPTPAEALAAAGAVAPITVDSPSGTVNTRVTFTGSGEPGADVVVYLTTTSGAPAGQPIATAQVGADGRWSLTATIPGGPQTLHFEQWASDGSMTSASVALRALTLSVDPLATPTADHPTITGSGVSGAPVAIYLTTSDGKPAGAPVGATTVGLDGRWSLVASLPGGPQTIVAATTWADDYVEVALDVVVAPTPFSADTPARVVPRDTTVTGTGQPGLTVQAWQTDASHTAAVGHSLASTTVDESGRWSLDLTLDPGAHHLYFGESTGQGDGATEIAGEIEALRVGEFDVTTPSGTAPATSTVEGVGLPGTTVAYWATTASGAAVGEPLGTTTVGTDGAWSLDVTLPVGTHTLWFGDIDGSVVQDEELAHEILTLTVLPVTDPTDPVAPVPPVAPTDPAAPVAPANPAATGPGGSMPTRTVAPASSALEQADDASGDATTPDALARTGSSVALLASFAALLTAAGAAALALVRRGATKS